MARRTKHTRSKKQKTLKRRRIGTMRFKKSNRPPRRIDVLGKTLDSQRKEFDDSPKRFLVNLRGGNNGAVVFPQSFPSVNQHVYNEDPSRHGIPASTLPDMKAGSRKQKKRVKCQRGGGFQQAYLNSINGLSELTNAGVSGQGIFHPPLITDITGISAFGSNLLSGPQQTTLTNTNPPLA